MPTLKQIRKRIGVIKNTQQITRAMKMVAAAKLRKAQERIFSARPYTFRLRDIVGEIIAREEVIAHPLLHPRPLEKILLLIITSDRGLCGSFNSNINRSAERYIKENKDLYKEISLAVIGKKARDYFRWKGYDIKKQYMEILVEPSLDKIVEIGEEIIAEFIDRNLDGVFIIYNEFKSAMQQRVVVEKLLPITTEEKISQEKMEFIYEPDKKTILNALLPLFINIQVYHAVLESLAAEMGARMTAMESATNNAIELIDKLTLQYNKARQSTITKELMEIIAGAEAIKG